MRHRDFALVQVGTVFSQVGLWMRFVALGWAIRELTSWPFAIALSLVAQFGPSLLVSPIAGSIADRFDRRRIIIFGNLAMMVPPLVIGYLISSGSQTVVNLLVVSAVGGVAQAFTQPAMSAIVAQVVPVAELPQAISASSVVQNLTRIVGPSIGVVGVWMLVHPAGAARKNVERVGFLEQTRSGIAYARSIPQIRNLLELGCVMLLFYFHAALLPVIARDVLGGGAGTFGLLTAATGVGAIFGALLSGEIVTDGRRRLAIAVGALGIGTAFAGIALSRVIAVTIAFLALHGFSFFLANAVTQSVLMTVTPDDYRGRVMGLLSTVSVGSIPFSAITAGLLASWIGAPATVGIAAVCMLSYTVWFLATRRLDTVGIDDVLHELESSPGDAPTASAPTAEGDAQTAR
jgi:MFS family permease